MPNFNTVQAGQTLTMVSNGHRDTVLFRGFTDYLEQYSETPVFHNLRGVKLATDSKTNKALEAVGEEMGYGHNVYAVFTALPENGESYNFTCYLFNGRWTCGSSADLVKLEEV